jgi:predicted NUDIX family NTP pyrophosphohydrolase
VAAKSAGILLYRRTGGTLEVLLVHHGGPFWAKKDLGSWSIPKGEIQDGEDPLTAARREFAEETGMTVDAPAKELPPAKQPSGKIVHAFVVEGDFDPAALKSNTFEMEWPRGSKIRRSFPEVDEAAWLEIAEARRKILPGQQPILDGLLRLLARK